MTHAENDNLPADVARAAEIGRAKGAVAAAAFEARDRATQANIEAVRVAASAKPAGPSIAAPAPRLGDVLSGIARMVRSGS